MLCRVLAIAYILLAITVSAFSVYFADRVYGYATATVSGFLLLSFLVATSSIVWSTFLGREALEETRSRGDVILRMASEYLHKAGKAPKSLGDLRSFGFQTPEPALKGSEFQILSGDQDKVSVTFSAQAFTVCQASRPGSWACED